MITSKTIVLPDDGWTNPYIVLADKRNGNLLNVTTGEVGADVAWGDAKVVGTRHAQSNDWVFEIAAIDDGYEYLFSVCDSSEPAKTDARAWTSYYSAKHDTFWGLLFPVESSRVRVAG